MSTTPASPRVKIAAALFVIVTLGLALVALDARQVGDSAYESYGAALARLRDARRSTRDARAAARLDAEIATFERERSTLRHTDATSPASRNAARVAPRRAELERVGP